MAVADTGGRGGGGVFVLFCMSVYENSADLDPKLPSP